jgi:predicted PurR-regulated permease PerM
MVATALAFFPLLSSGSSIPAGRCLGPGACRRCTSHEWIARRIFRPNVAAAVALAVVAATVVAPTLFVTQRLVGEAMKAAETIQTEAASGRWHAIIQRNPQLAPILRRIEAHVDLRGTVEWTASMITARFSSFVRGSVWFLLELVVTFFFCSISSAIARWH